MGKNKVFQSSLLLSFFTFKRWQSWKTSETWQPLQENLKRNDVGTASHGARPLPELATMISLRFLRTLMTDSVENFLEFSRTESCILEALPTLDKFLLDPKYGHFSEPFPELPGIQTQGTINQRGIFCLSVPQFKELGTRRAVSQFSNN